MNVYFSNGEFGSTLAWRLLFFAHLNEETVLISIVYDSGYGHTAKQAKAVAQGVLKVAGARVELIPLADGKTPWETLETSDAIVFGAPTYNGAPSARFKQFCEDSTRPAWVGISRGT